VNPLRLSIPLQKIDILLILGDIVSVTVLGQRLIILNSLKACIDLLEKKSSVMSDRPPLIMAGKLIGWDHSLVLSPYGDRFRDIRKFLHQYIGSRGQLDKMEPFHELVEKETHKFLGRLLRHPDEFADHVRKYAPFIFCGNHTKLLFRTAGAIILKMAYGYQVIDGDSEDPMVEQVDRSVRGFVASVVPGSFLVDTIPARKFLCSLLILRSPASPV
jgi:hypothetical protein